MLQQTQAVRVVPFFERFMEGYPEPAALAQAPLSEVLAMWSGLGYNRRALRLREAARQINDHGWPSDARRLEGLPGIGSYTAAAIACFAFGEQLPTVETNLRRVLSRWYGKPLAGRDLTEAAQEELPCGRAVDWNQAMMDLGAVLCKPREPRCGVCPVVDWCAGKDTYVAPRPQGGFSGSSREARGAVLRALVGRGRSTAMEIGNEAGIAESRVLRSLAALVSEGLVAKVGAEFHLPDG